MSKPPMTWDETGKLVELTPERERALMAEASKQFHRENVDIPEPKYGLTLEERRRSAGYVLNRWVRTNLPFLRLPWEE